MNGSRGDHRPDHSATYGPAYFAEQVTLTLHERRGIDGLERFVAADDPAFVAMFAADAADAGAPQPAARRWRFWRRAR